ELRQDRRHARAIHLAIDLLREVFVGRVGEDLAAAAPQRAVGLTGARPSGALLLPRLLVRLVHLAARLLRAIAAARVCLERDDDLMDQRLVVFAAEELVGGRERRRGLAGIVDELQVHAHSPFFTGVFTAGLTTMWPPSAPGTAPFTRSSPRAASTRTTLS